MMWAQYFLHQEHELFNYCGLTVRSDFPLRIARLSAGEPAFDFRLLPPQEVMLEPAHWVRDSASQDRAPWLSIAENRGAYLLRFHELADFTLLDAGSVIECRPRKDTPPETIRHLFLDQVLPMALACQGRIVLHGAAVQSPRGALVILGESGWGKSTLTAALALRGCPLLTDDCLLLEEREDQFYCLPSYSAVRLWPDSATALFGGEIRPPRVAHYSAKRLIDSHDFGLESAKGAIPLWRIYALSSPAQAESIQTIEITPLSGKAALMKITENSFLLDPSDQSVMARRFHSFGKLASSIAVRRLTIPREYAWLSIACETILADN
jgi:hypothetical protein